MTFNLLTLTVSLLATLLLLGSVAWYSRRRELVFRQDTQRMVDRLQLILSHQATQRDWDLFLALPIRNNLELEKVRQACCEIGETEYIGNPFNIPDKPLFTEWGLILLERQLNQARALIEEDP